MLSRHLELLVHPNEPQYILELYERFGDTIRDRTAALDYVIAHPYLPDTVDREALQRSCGDTSSVHLRELIQCCLHVWGGEALQRKRPVLKDPALTFHLELIHDLFPGAYIVHIVRDPRGNVSSQRARWPDASVWECATWWRDAVRAARTWQQQGKTPYTELKYEDLVLSPEATLQELCQNLNIPYYPEMLDFEFKGNLYAPDAPPKSVRFTTVKPSRVTIWKERLTPIEVRLIEACCQTEMSWWQYKRNAPHVPHLRYVRRYLYERAHYRLLTSARTVKHAIRRFGWRHGFTRSITHDGRRM